jgi:hypothetical protein
MMMRFDNIVSLPSGNTARNFCVRDRGHGRVQVTYVYTDRRRAHQVSRYFLVEFLNGRLESITARSARGGRVESFSTSIILNVLHEMLSEVSKANEALTNFRKDVAEMRAAEASKVEAPVEQDDTSDLLDTLKTVGTMVAINLMVTLATLGIVWYNL